MDRQTRIAVLVDHFKRPRHKFEMADADARMPGGNPGCGDLVTMFVKADPDSDRLEAVSFVGEGCTISQAAASILADRMNKKKPTFEQVSEMSFEQMIEMLGEDIVGSRPRCATLALGTLKAAVRRIDTDRRLRGAGHSDAAIRVMREAIDAQAAGTGLVFGDDAVKYAGQGGHPPDDPLNPS
jgi:nitrogen fixation protein NifU and related proteins